MGEAQQSFVAELIEKEKQHNLTKKETAWLAGIML